MFSCTQILQPLLLALLSNLIPSLLFLRASLVAQTVKNLPALQETQETQVQSLGREDALEEGMATHPVLLPGESHGRGAWWSTVHRVEESDMTEAT